MKKSLLVLVIILTVLSWYFISRKKQQIVWSKTLPGIGTFSSPRVEDVNKDGTLDIIIGAGKSEFSNGGDIKVPPFNPNRAAGRLAIMSSASGKVLAKANMPDDKEIYMSVAVDFDSNYPTDSKIIFGTGGETVPGNLFIGTSGMILKGDLSAATQLATGPKKGFIAPPAWVELNGDGVRDIVANSVD